MRQRRNAGILTAESVKYFCGEAPDNERRFETQPGKSILPDGIVTAERGKYVICPTGMMTELPEKGISGAAGNCREAAGGIKSNDLEVKGRNIL